TLQIIANRCDAPLRDKSGKIIGSPTLLVCIGGDRLIAECGCSSSTFWSQLRTLQALGYVVPLTNGGGRLASVYGIYPHATGSGPGGNRNAPEPRSRRRGSAAAYGNR
ncbi:MAG: hypothetical protein O7C65_02605, partial [Planctomycetota bacterium]|nr:hypothetical protein [Planctomycetota bacterium]